MMKKIDISVSHKINVVNSNWDENMISVENPIIEEETLLPNNAEEDNSIDENTIQKYDYMDTYDPEN